MSERRDEGIKRRNTEQTITGLLLRKVPRKSKVPISASIRQYIDAEKSKCSPNSTQDLHAEDWTVAFDWIIKHPKLLMQLSRRLPPT